MMIGRQWADRLRIWAEQFEKHTMTRALALPVSFFTTMDRLSFEKAAARIYAPAHSGMRWGKKWEYGWFYACVTVPDALAGERLELCLGVGEEMLVYVNGQARGAIDKKHKSITLSRCAKAGDVYEIHAECYADHGVRNEGAGPVADGEEPVPEPPAAQQTVRESTVEVWNETVFQAAMDYLTLYALLKKLPEKSLRAMQIIKGLKRFTMIADFELPREEMTKSVAEAAKVLSPLLACKNGSTAPRYTVFGQSHLDLAWLWPVEETERKCARTYANQLALMEEYPEYRFLLCEPPILEMLKRHYPAVYARVKENAAQFIPEGALWVEADTNIPSGESLIRQFVLGKRWFREEWGVESRMAWMPDTFGFSAALPQIMKKCQVDCFATQKLTRQDPECEPFPYNLFWWEGLDGSRVLSHIFKKNNANFNAGDLITRWEDDRVQQEDIDGLMYPFGFGDGGGGPTREMLETLRRCRDLEGAPRCVIESPVRYFERAQETGVENVFRGELYLAWHRGTYTAQAQTKRAIRKAEAALKAVLYALSLRILEGNADPAWKGRIDALEKTLLFNHFHDIAPGSSIARVHERAERELFEVESGCRALIGEMLGKPDAVPVAVNPLGFARRVGGVTVPAQGAAVLVKPSEEAPKATCIADGDGFVLKNAHLVCRVNARGEVVSLRRVGDSREYMAGAGNRFLMFKDVNTCYDAWELSEMAREMPVALEEPATLRIVQEEGGAALEVMRRLHLSTLVQRIVLGDDAQRVDFVTKIDWQEKHKLLKVAFPVNARADEAKHEIQFGFVRRPVHRSHRHDRDRYEVCMHRYTALDDGAGGAAVLSESKYGVNVEENEIRLTLLRAPMMPDMHADRGMQIFTYAVYPFEGATERSDVLAQAAELNEPPILAGSMPQSGPVFLSDSRNVVVETIRPAETVKNALLVRAYEAMGMQSDVHFAVSDRVARICEVDMLEEHARPLDGGLPVRFGSFEIKSFLMMLRD